MHPDIIINVHSPLCKVASLLSDFNHFEFSRQIFDKSLKTKFYANPFIGSRVVPFRQTDRQRALTKLIVGFHNFTNALKMVECKLNNKNK